MKQFNDGKALGVAAGKFDCRHGVVIIASRSRTGIAVRFTMTTAQELP
jgi:hypothetical protein